LSRCSFSSYWKININQLQIQSMIWASTLQIRKHGYFSDLDFIILFVGIFPLYAINLGAVSLFADSSFTFLTMFVSDILYQFKWMNIILFLSKRNREKDDTVSQTINNKKIFFIFFLYLWGKMTPHTHIKENEQQ